MDRLIYIVGVGDNPVKIGIADNMAKRLSSLQTGCPDPLTVHRVYRSEFSLAPTIEARAHLLLAEHHRRGEWFNVHHEAAAEAVLAALRLTVSERMEALKQPSKVVLRLATMHSLHPWADSAVNFYRSIRSSPTSSSHRAPYERALEAGGGYGAFALFHRVVMERASIESVAAKAGVPPSRIEKILVAAINEMAALYARNGRPVIAGADALIEEPRWQA
jgi:hypothetical protein